MVNVYCGSVVCCKNTKYRMRNDLPISMTEPNLSDPDVREFSYRGVRIHRSLDLPPNAQHLRNATAQVHLNFPTSLAFQSGLGNLTCPPCKDYFTPNSSAGEIWKYVKLFKRANISGTTWHHW